MPGYEKLKDGRTSVRLPKEGGGQEEARPGGGGSQNGAEGTDYSAQWAEYYRSIGKVKEAEAIEAARVSKSTW